MATLPTEQTKLMMAIRGAIKAFWTDVQIPWFCMNTIRQRESGTKVLSMPATTKPISSSLRSIVRSASA